MTFVVEEVAVRKKQMLIDIVGMVSCGNEVIGENVEEEVSSWSAYFKIGFHSFLYVEGKKGIVYVFFGRHFSSLLRRFEVF